jgi:nitronate monooxygenase
MQRYEDTLLPFPIQNALTSAMRKKAKEQGNTDFMSLFAGQKAYLCQNISAGKLIEMLNDEVTALLK